MFGGDGNDRFSVSFGGVAYGGAGADTFALWDGSGTIMDFTAGEDVVTIQGMAASAYALETDGTLIGRFGAVGTVTQVGDDVAVTSRDGNTTTFVGVTIADLGLARGTDDPRVPLFATAAADTFRFGDEADDDAPDYVISGFAADDTLVFDDYSYFYLKDDDERYVSFDSSRNLYVEYEYDYDTGEWIERGNFAPENPSVSVVDGDTVVAFDRYTITLEDYTGPVAFDQNIIQ